MLTGVMLIAPVLHIVRTAFDKDSVKAAIEGSMKPIGLGLLLTALLA